MIIEYLTHLLNMALDTAVWLLLGLLIAAIIKLRLSERWVQRWLQGDGIGPVVRAAFIGAPLPLCSCGVLPAAIGLHRAGASRAATTSFLVSTPETGIDSISVSYALLGPVMAIIRPIAAIISAIVAGLLVLFATGKESTQHNSDSAIEEDNCCKPKDSCCSSGEAKPEQENPAISQRPLTEQLQAGFFDIFDDIKLWLLAGLMLAAGVATLVEPNSLHELGSGLPAMLVMLVVGLPLYICATASTPLAASLLVAGISPGTVLVFMLVGPATNIGSLIILAKELGQRTVILYLLGLSLSALLLGGATDLIIDTFKLVISPLEASMQEYSSLFSGLQWISLVLLILAGSKALWLSPKEKICCGSHCDD